VSDNLGRYLRVCFVSSVIGTVLGVWVPAAYADSAWGSWGIYSMLGIGFKARSAVTVFVDGSGATARTEVGTQTGQLVPTQYMGCQARPYNGSNALKASSDWGYNGAPANDIYMVSPKDPNHGYYYGKGMTAAWNGSDYTYYETFPSPVLHNPL
jgi:hypothetical protein